jgi:hypothetical protein
VVQLLTESPTQIHNLGNPNQLSLFDL